MKTESVFHEKVCPKMGSSNRRKYRAIFYSLVRQMVNVLSFLKNSLLKTKVFFLALALARKYRPRTFDDLIGQESVSLSLSHALKNNRLSHAYLFSGLRGSGKTSTARIFAKALLCEKGPTPKPCQECIQCQMANENRHIDIIEMDGGK